MDDLVTKLVSASLEQFARDIDTFHESYGSRTSFHELSNDNLREKLWEKLFHYLSDSEQSSVHYRCLSALRILSRDKTDLDKIITNERINAILEIARLTSNAENKGSSFTEVEIEALKLLCNLLFNSTKVQRLVPETPCLRCLTERMRSYNDDVPHEVKLFDSRILFLITALNVSTRQVVRVELKGDLSLVKVLVDICARTTNIIKAEDIALACEVLKALFNLYINADDEETQDEERNEGLSSILYKLLSFKCSEKEDDLHSNVANLLTVVPFGCYKSIIPKASKDSQSVFQDTDMTAISALLKFLDRRLNCKEDLIGSLTPIVTAFIRLVRTEKPIRRYVRLQILPPLKDVMKRPEEGTSLRAKLCKLLTSPVTEVRDLVAEFLFILCKENVSRMVKYTGYGNAAGMFANKGLLGPNRKAANSSESEDSDTEEYLKHKEQINPVTGCFEHPKPNPLEGMSEEQKEYEALQLVGLVDKLTRGGVVQPCRIGDDGKPKPIEHVLELQEELPKQQITNRDSDSD